MLIHNDDNASTVPESVDDVGTIVLETDALPTTLPMSRAKGVHVSDVIHSLAVALGHYTPSDDFNYAQLELGSAYEYGLIGRLRDTHPTQFIQPGEMTVDDLHGNLDQFNLADWLVEEFKHSKITVRHDPTALDCPACDRPGPCRKFWKWWVQTAAYCHMVTTLYFADRPVRECRLRVLFARGDYKGRGDEQYRQWRRRFTDNEIAQTWSMLVGHSHTLRCQECIGLGVSLQQSPCRACNGSGVKLTATT
jgi:hypothetical protein